MTVREKERDQEIRQLPNGKMRILESLSDGSKTNAEIESKTGLSGPVISEHLASLANDGLILAPPKIRGLRRSERGAKYEITPKGRELVLREEDRRFSDEAGYFRPYDLEPYLLKRPWTIQIGEGIPSKNPIKFRDVTFYREPVDTPEEVLEREFPIFPLPIRAVLRMNDNATFAVKPWFYHEMAKYGIKDKDDERQEHLFKEIAYRFADPHVRKLCEVLFERTRVLSSLHSSGEKRTLPTLDNILNFNIEILCRYEGEKLLGSLSKEERVKTQHLLAGTLLLYLGGSGSGPIESFGWHKEDLEALVKSGVLTREEIQPLLEACKPLQRGLRYEDLTDEQKKEIDATGPPGVKHSHTGFYHGVNLTEEQKRKMQYDYVLSDLTDEQKRKITVSAYRRFYLADHEDYDKIFSGALPAKIGERPTDGEIMIVQEKEAGDDSLASEKKVVRSS